MESFVICSRKILQIAKSKRIFDLTRFISYISIFIFFFTISACKSNKEVTTSSTTSPKSGHIPTTNTPIRFKKSTKLTPLLDLAKAQKKPVFIDFYTTWCGPCKQMDREVFRNRKVANFHNKEFINYKVDCEKGNGRNLASIFNIRAYPTLLFVDHKGNVLERHEGMAYPTKLLDMGEKAIRKYKQQYP